MAVNPFNEFVKTELPLRPILSVDGNQESVLIRRGVGPRVFESLDINEGEVVGKSGGIMSSVPFPNGASPTTHSILANSTKVIATYLKTAFVSKKTIIEIDDGSSFESFEMLMGKTTLTNFDHSIYGIVGNLAGYNVTVNNLTSTIAVSVTNTNAFALSLTYREIT